MRFTEKWKNVWNFEKKMYIVIMSAILLLTIAAISISTVSFGLHMTRQNNEYASAQLDSMADDYADNLDQYKALATSMILSKDVQSYSAAKSVDEAYRYMGDVYSTLLNIFYMQSNANFLAVTNDTLETYVYCGNYSVQKMDYENGIDKDFDESMPANEAGSLRISFSDRFGSRSGQYSLTVYFPVYSLTKMVSSNGFVIINLNDNILRRIQEKNGITDARMYLVSRDGMIVSAGENDRMHETIPYAGKLAGNEGSFWHEGSKVSYRRVGTWNYYLIYEIPGIRLYRNVIQMAVIMLGVIIALAAVTLVISRQAISRLYRPLNKIVRKMNDVSGGNLGTRIHTIDHDSDSRMLAEGFNRMMDEIDELLDAVKREERQMTQMQLNALQSQIQPHFLYNSLECIHWQAAADGNREISVMVKALAQYYRICLSGGRDIISLETELEHVRNYLIIQNMRYDNIISLEIDIPEEYRKIMLPKLTLQPLIENSIYHGIRIKEGRKGLITIRVRDEGDDVVLLVADDGKGMEPEEIERMNQTIREFDRTSGYGTNNVNKRLELLFGEAYGLRFCAREEGGLLVEIRLPKRQEEHADVSGSDCR